MNPHYQSGTRVSEYLLEAPIAAGAFGEVWRARHHLWTEEEVAIKLPTSPEYVRYLQREGMLVHGLRHPNIVRVLGVDPYSAIPYLVMELVHGPSLDRVIADHRGGLPLEAVIAIVRGVLHAVSAAHEGKVLHRDLKPANVLLNLGTRPVTLITADDVKVTDFGLGAGGLDTLRSIAQSTTAERDEPLMGTLAYMAPEVRDGQRVADERSDLFSVGIILFEMLTGERPAGVESPGSLRADTPRALDEVFARLYARHDRRYAGADEALEDLNLRLGAAERRMLAGQSRPSQGTGARLPPPPPPQAADEIRCPKCGHNNEADSQFCVMCRHQLVSSVRRCVKCQAWPGPDDLYCIRCGATLDRVGE